MFASESVWNQTRDGDEAKYFFEHLVLNGHFISLYKIVDRTLNIYIYIDCLHYYSIFLKIDNLKNEMIKTSELPVLWMDYKIV